LIRDIPATEIVAGSNVTNLSQLVHEKLLKEYQENKKIREEFYKRLYENYTVFTEEKELIRNLLKEGPPPLQFRRKVRTLFKNF
jgi:histone acetyltransferase (RNA polymerase elongator complex component)